MTARVRPIVWIAALALRCACAGAPPPPMPAAPLAVEWLTVVGGRGPQLSFAVVPASASGGAVLALETRGAALVNGKPLPGLRKTSAEPLAALIGLDARGRPRWSQALAGSGAQPKLRALARGHDGMLFAAGGFNFRLQLLGSALPELRSIGGSDALLLALGADGMPRRLQRFGGKYGDTLRALAGDGAGGVYAAGQLRLSARFGQHAGSTPRILASHGGSDILVMHIDASGTMLWSRALGGNGDDRALALAAASDGGVYVLAEYRQGFALQTASGSIHLPSRGAGDGLLMHLDAHGQVLAATPIGSSAPDHFDVLAAHGSHVVMAGSLSSARTLHTGETSMQISPAGASDTLLLDFDQRLKVRRHARIGGSGISAVTQLAFDSSGALWCSGNFSGKLTLGGHALTGEHDDGFVAELDPQLQIRRALLLGGRGAQHPFALAATRRGMLVAGSFTKSLTAQGMPRALPGSGGADAFVALIAGDAAAARITPQPLPPGTPQEEDD